MKQTHTQERFGRLLDEHRGIPIKVAAAYCANAADRQDLVQTIAMEAWRAYPRFDPSRVFSTWLYRIALNVAISFARAQRRHTDRIATIGDDALTQYPAPESGDRPAVLEAMLSDLNEFERALVILYLEEQPYSAIAEILGISQTNVATKLSRIKERLRRQALDAQNV